jgi:hypothetical protein
MALARDSGGPTSFRGHVPRWLWHAIGLAFAALLGYAIWRGYQNPDFLLDLGAFRIC